MKILKKLSSNLSVAQYELKAISKILFGEELTEFTEEQENQITAHISAGAGDRQITKASDPKIGVNKEDLKIAVNKDNKLVDPDKAFAIAEIIPDAKRDKAIQNALFLRLYHYRDQLQALKAAQARLYLEVETSEVDLASKLVANKPSNLLKIANDLFDGTLDVQKGDKSDEEFKDELYDLLEQYSH